MIIYVIFQYLLILVAATLIGYQLLLGLLALMPHHKQRIEKAASNHSFLLVIHLQNKEQEISRTLYSLYGLVYPSNLFKLLIIADQCTENTANIARKFGAIIFERKNDQYKSWSETLQWALEQIQLWEEKYDAIVVIEPGGLISGNFLAVMNHYLEQGSTILQSSTFDVVTSGSWRIKFDRTARLIYNHINSLGRKKMGLGTKLFGNGMCFKAIILKNMLTELSRPLDDFDYRMPLLMKRNQVDFVPEALIWSRLNDSSGERKSRKTKVGDSHFQMVKKHIKKFINHFINNKSLQNFDALISLITPSLKDLLMETGGMAIINWGLWKLGYISVSFFWIWIILFGMVFTYLLIGVVTDRAIFINLINTPLKKRQVRL